MKILLVEDEPNVSTFIRKGLEEHEYSVVQAFDGEQGWALARKETFDLVIMDIFLPKMTGLEILKKLRESERNGVPVLMLTALGTTDDVVKGLETGADDYLTKPFKLKELLARIQALLRRKDHYFLNRKLIVEDLVLDPEAKTVERQGSPLQLTTREFQLLEYLMKQQGRVVSRQEILESVWQLNFDTGTNVIDVYVNYLRKKVDKGFSPKLIHTVVGMGYVLKAEP